MDYIEISAKTIEGAIEEGKVQLAKEHKVVTDTKVLEEPSSGFLGFGRKQALVRIYFEEVKNEATAQKTTTPVEPQKESVEQIKHEEVKEEIPVKDSTLEVKEDYTEKEEALTKEEQLEIAEKGKEFLHDMFKQMGLSVQIEKLTSPNKITFQVHGEDLGILIGKHGQTLDAIQYLTNLVANKEVRHRCRIVVDVENYRARREETLVNLAHRIGAKVRRNRQKVTLEPMNAFERKIIHLALQDEKHIITHSEGDEPYRHVVIAYKR